MTDWRPGASRARLLQRAVVLRAVRAFFEDRGVLEVTTPSIGRFGAPDLHLQSIPVVDGAIEGYLQTSPEYAMKRLLAAGSGAIYQIGPAFRGGEQGSRHNREFTMLEWYRPGFDLEMLASELEELVRQCAGVVGTAVPPITVVSYRSLFEAAWSVNPHAASTADLVALGVSVPQLTAHLDENAGAADWLDALFVAAEAKLVGATIVRDFPECQAALAETGVNAVGDNVARRFELFLDGVEIANAYAELRDAVTLEERFLAANQARRQRALPEMPIDRRLLDALPLMPACSGIALGIDRLLMRLLGAGSLDEVIAFSGDRG